MSILKTRIKRLEKDEPEYSTFWDWINFMSQSAPRPTKPLDPQGEKLLATVWERLQKRSSEKTA